MGDFEAGKMGTYNMRQLWTFSGGFLCSIYSFNISNRFPIYSA